MAQMGMVLASFFFLAGGALVLHLGWREYAAHRVVMLRFRHYVAPRFAGPRLAALGVGALEWIGRRVLDAASVRELQAALQQAGWSNPAAPFIFGGLRLASTIGVLAATVTPPYLRHGAVPLKNAVLYVFMAFFVYRAFTIMLKARIEARQREIRRELPYVLDLVLMVLDSGVSIDQALHHVGAHVGKVAQECGALLARYNADTEDGVPYDAALDRLAQRLAIGEGRDFAGLLKQNLSQGGELNPPLRRLAADIGETRLAMAREQMGRKSVMLTLVMLGFFMPVLMIALAGPAVSDIVNTLSGVASDMRNSRTGQ
jgi:tight adherence protein C